MPALLESLPGRQKLRLYVDGSTGRQVVGPNDSIDTIVPPIAELTLLRDYPRPGFHTIELLVPTFGCLDEFLAIQFDYNLLGTAMKRMAEAVVAAGDNPIV